MREVLRDPYSDSYTEPVCPQNELLAVSELPVDSADTICGCPELELDSRDRPLLVDTHGK